MLAVLFPWNGNMQATHVEGCRGATPASFHFSECILCETFLHT